MLRQMTPAIENVAKKPGFSEAGLISVLGFLCYCCVYKIVAISRDLMECGY